MSETENSRTCYNCKNYFTSYFCGYNSSNCKVYGSLDMDQKVRHPDTAAESCDRYEGKKSDIVRHTFTAGQYREFHVSEPKRRLIMSPDFLDRVECPKIKMLLLKHIGRDSWGRPVYEDESGRLWKDVEPRAGKVPKLCTALYNNFDGEPDIPLEAMERYKDARIVFVPERDTWTW